MLHDVRTTRMGVRVRVESPNNKNQYYTHREVVIVIIANEVLLVLYAERIYYALETSEKIVFCPPPLAFRTDLKH